MKIQKIAIAAVAVTAALSLSACSSSNNDDDTTTSSSTTTATTTEAPEMTLPTAAELNAMLKTGLDPNVPASEKTNLVEGIEADPELINQVAQAAVANNVQVEVLDPVYDAGDGTAAAALQASINGEPASGLSADFVPAPDGTHWQLAKTTVCTLTQALNIQTPVCPA